MKVGIVDPIQCISEERFHHQKKANFTLQVNVLYQSAAAIIIEPVPPFVIYRSTRESLAQHHFVLAAHKLTNPKSNSGVCIM